LHADELAVDEGRERYTPRLGRQFGKNTYVLSCCCGGGTSVHGNENGIVEGSWMPAAPRSASASSISSSG